MNITDALCHSILQISKNKMDEILVPIGDGGYTPPRIVSQIASGIATAAADQIKNIRIEVYVLTSPLCNTVEVFADRAAAERANKSGNGIIRTTKIK